MQDENLQQVNKGGFICGLPRPFWQILGRSVQPVFWEFKALDFVAISCRDCDCMLVLQRRETRTRHRAVENGLYRCTVCDKVGSGNSQETILLNAVKAVVQARREPIVCCCQMPLASKRFDVVLIPLHATLVKHLVVLELDGTDHSHKPRLNGLSMNAAYNTVVDRDAEKARIVRDHGMLFMRISISEVPGTEWEQKLNDVLDQANAAV